MGEGLETSFWVMVIVQTIGSVDIPGKGSRKMPSPRQYVAIVVAWTVLFIIGNIGQQSRRAASAIAWALVLTGLVVGPFGKRVLGLFAAVPTTAEQAAANALSNNPSQIFGGQGTGTATPATPRVRGVTASGQQHG